MEYLLWEENTPGFNKDYNQPVPSLTPYFAANSNGKKRGCIIVAPGGGYMGRAFHEGEPISQMLNTAGIHSFVLNYRVAPYKYPVQLYDINRAVRYVRYYADKFGIDKNKIGILGFSAGGHLCTMGIENFDYGIDDGNDIDKVSSRPDAGILCYAVISMVSYVNEGSRDSLLGQNYDQTLAKQLSGENSVRDDTPPVFMWHTAGDSCVPVENSLNMAFSLSKKKIPFEMHIFPEGDHGLGLSESIPETAQWSDLLKKWLLKLGF